MDPETHSNLETSAQRPPTQIYVYLQGPYLELNPVKDTEGSKASHTPTQEARHRTLTRMGKVTVVKLTL